MSYNVISLEDMKEALGEKTLKTLLNSFECPLNEDVEYFIRDKAIQFLKMGVAKTFLVTTTHKGEHVIVGYFALADKVTKVKKKALTRTYKKRIAKFAKGNEYVQYYLVNLPLIGQLGKNFRYKDETLITGDVLLKLACDKVREAQRILGGQFVYLECEDKPKLKNFYESNGFVCFGKRNIEKDERSKNAGGYLLQMLRDLRHN